MNCYCVEPTVKKLLNMIYAPMYTKTLFSALELEVFFEMQADVLHTEVAERLNLHPENTRLLLNALAGMGFLEKTGRKYRNSELVNKYLLRDSEWFIGDHLRIYSGAAGFDGIDMVKLIKEGPDSEAVGKEGLEAYAVFGDWSKMMKKLQRGGRAKEISDMVAGLPEFNSFGKMLDLGGGPGLICLAIVNRHPELKAVIFDTVEVGRVAAESIKESNLESRVEVMAGDYLKDPIGEGYDFILAIGTLNFAKHNLDLAVRKIYDALNSNGVFMCISEGLTHEDTNPQEIVVSWLPSLLKGFDFSLQQGEVSDAALRIGFKSVYKQTVSLLIGDMDVDIARK